MEGKRINCQALVKGILDHLARNRTSYAKFSTLCRLLNKPGVYAFFVDTPNLGSFPILSDRQIIYIGISIDLAGRLINNHFDPGQTSFSSPRRSLGAIFKDDMNLMAISRGRGKSNSDFFCYRFRRDAEHDGELRLTKWMKENLEVGVYEYQGTESDSKKLKKNLKELEQKIIPEAKPILNLNKWPNPCKDQINLLRAHCRDQARKQSHK